MKNKALFAFIAGVLAVKLWPMLTHRGYDIGSVLIGAALAGLLAVLLGGK